MRSVEVVLPASMWAMMPMLRISPSWNGRAISGTPISPETRVVTRSRPRLPAIVREGLVGFGHAVDVFLLLNRAAAAVGGVHQFFGQLVDHRLTGACARVKNQPANGQRLAAKRIDLDRNLIVGTANAPRLHF